MRAPSGLAFPPFRALPFEYPPLALAPVTLTLFPAGAGPYVAFGIWMGAVAVLVYLMLALGWSRRSAISFVIYLLVGAIAVALSRYDLAPVAFTVAAWIVAERKRFSLAYLLLAVGVLLKLYPLFLFPVFAIAHWRFLQSHEDGARRAPSYERRARALACRAEPGCAGCGHAPRLRTRHACAIHRARSRPSPLHRAA